VEPGAKPSWRDRPLMKRLPLLVFAGLGLFLWQVTAPPERELVWRLEGEGWNGVSSLDIQVMNSEGQILKRQERFFHERAWEVTVKMDLPEGTYKALLFLRGPQLPDRPPVVDTLTIGEERYVQRVLRLP
jgi:hypothetical protein